MASDLLATFPVPLSAYPPLSRDGLLATLGERVALNPFNAVATGIFFLAICHTLAAARFATLARRVQSRDDARACSEGRRAGPSVRAELLHILGEVEVVFGLWAVVLLIAISAYAGWNTAAHYLNEVVNYTEPLFVVVIMALSSSRPIIGLAEAALRRVASLGGDTPGA
ncbi:MAG TPA: putative Na+/H+ antiporter, partial [Candidatus Binataceae bacterium]|nr:putative Na+/H+ antiporter [Candidatus Binataceae bacterium]